MKRLYTIIVAALIASFSLSLTGQTTGTLSYKITTSDVGGGKYSPKYVFVVWVTDNAGAFVKTLYYIGSQKSDLVTYFATPGINQTNAVTGATFTTSPQNLTITWDAKNSSNAVVTDGTYKVRVEQTNTDKPTQGPLYTFSFNKSATAITNTTLTDQSPFINMSYTWTPPSNIAVTGVTVAPSTLNILPAGTSTLTATIAPANATNKAVTWTSSDPTVATVSGAGVVTAVKVGTTTVTAKTTDGNFTSTCAVTVTSAAVAVTSVSLSKMVTSIAIGANETITASVLPVNATNMNVTWSSSNTAVATVANGIITGVKAGTANIVVTTVDGSFKDTCVVSIVPVAIEDQTIQALSIFPNPVGTTLQLSFDAVDAGKATLDIFSETGTRLISKDIAVTADKNIIAVPVEKLAAGLYFVSIKLNGLSVTKPFFIEK